jgi:hypothetical protein
VVVNNASGLEEPTAYAANAAEEPMYANDGSCLPCEPCPSCNTTYEGGKRKTRRAKRSVSKNTRKMK